MREPVSISGSVQKPVAMVFNGVWSHYAVATAPKYRDLIQMIYVHELTGADLQRYSGIVIPFQNNHTVIAQQREALSKFLASGKRIAVFGDGGDWTGAQWQSRSVDNYWWADEVKVPPVADTDFSHALFAGLTPRQAGYHHHGIYSRIPEGARVLQRSRDGEIVSWSTTEHGGELFAGTQDPIVEHGVQQIQHLDHFVDGLLFWLCSQRPAAGKMTLDPEAYGKLWSLSA